MTNPSDKPGGVRRWKLWLYCPPSYDIEEDEDAEGDWVKVEDHERIVERLNAEIEKHVQYAQLQIGKRTIVEISLAEKDRIIERLTRSNERMKAALEFYAQEPIPESGTPWSDSCKQWGVESMTWDPLMDLGKCAREALAEIDSLNAEESK